MSAEKNFNTLYKTPYPCWCVLSTTNPLCADKNLSRSLPFKRPQEFFSAFYRPIFYWSIKALVSYAIFNTAIRSWAKDFTTKD
jgi:hypothetical protein